MKQIAKDFYMPTKRVELIREVLTGSSERLVEIPEWDGRHFVSFRGGKIEGYRYMLEIEIGLGKAVHLYMFEVPCD